jgi:hypothetical protein
MIKTLYLMKRKPELSRTEFRTYYEDVHRRMGEKVLGVLAARYVRHYLEPVRVPHGAPAYDVATEIWFTDRQRFERAMAELAQDDFITDFKRLFDMDGASQYLFEDSESDLGD